MTRTQRFRRIAAVLLVVLPAGFAAGVVAENKKSVYGIYRTVFGTPSVSAEEFVPNPYYKTKVSLHRLLKVGPKDVLLVGDSITDFSEFQELLEANNIKNRGINGDSTLGVMHRIAELAEHRPATIFLLCGINDIQGRVTLDRTVRQYEKILSTIVSMSPTTTIYVQSVLPTNEAIYAREIVPRNPGIHPPSKEEVGALNTALKMLSGVSPRTTYVDLAALLDERGDLRSEFTVDGLHLNGEGMRAWTRLLEPMLLLDTSSAGREMASTK